MEPNLPESGTLSKIHHVFFMILWFDDLLFVFLGVKFILFSSWVNFLSVFYIQKVTVLSTRGKRRIVCVQLKFVLQILRFLFSTVCVNEPSCPRTFWKSLICVCDTSKKPGREIFEVLANFRKFRTKDFLLSKTFVHSSKICFHGPFFAKILKSPQIFDLSSMQKLLTRFHIINFWGNEYSRWPNYLKIELVVIGEL